MQCIARQPLPGNIFHFKFFFRAVHYDGIQRNAHALLVGQAGAKQSGKDVCCQKFENGFPWWLVHLNFTLCKKVYCALLSQWLANDIVSG